MASRRALVLPFCFAAFVSSLTTAITTASAVPVSTALWIFFCSSMIAYISASGRGGQPATYTSTGKKLSTPGTVEYEP